MDIVIKIPKEFEKDFNEDRFEDCLARVASDIEAFGFRLAGRYEQETITMLREAFKNGKPLPKGHERLIDVKDFYENLSKDERATFSRHDIWMMLRPYSGIPTIIRADKTDKE